MQTLTTLAMKSVYGGDSWAGTEDGRAPGGAPDDSDAADVANMMDDCATGNPVACILDILSSAHKAAN